MLIFIITPEKYRYVFIHDFLTWTKLGESQKPLMSIISVQNFNDVSQLLHWEIKKTDFSFLMQIVSINSYVCVQLVERKAGRIFEDKRESAKRTTDENNGERIRWGGVQWKKGRKRKGGKGSRKVGRFPGGPISWDSHYLPPWIPATKPHPPNSFYHLCHSIFSYSYIFKLPSTLSLSFEPCFLSSFTLFL